MVLKFLEAEAEVEAVAVVLLFRVHYFFFFSLKNKKLIQKTHKLTDGKSLYSNLKYTNAAI